jgi:glycosyltransferase involved in cell wall biosynthesis
MKVLYVNHTSTVSGAERSLLGLLRHLPAGVEPVVACPMGPLAAAVLGLGIEVEKLSGTSASLRLHPVHTSRGVAEIVWSGLQLGRIARRRGARLVHCNSVRAGLACLTGFAADRAATIVHVRDGFPAGRAADFSRRVAMRAGLVIANSRWTASRLELGLRGPRLEVVPNAVELDRFDPGLLSREEARARLRLGEHGHVLGVVGQLTPWKAQDDAIRATALLARRWPDLKLLVVGSVKFRSGSTRYDNEAYLASLHGLVDELSLHEQVRFLGEREDIPGILRALDVLLVPSWEEPFGRVVIEGMAMSTPVLATANGGPAEVIPDGVDGLLLPPRDPAGWADGIRQLLADPARRGSMGRSARAKVETQFDQPAQAALIADLYRQQLEGAVRA